MATFNGTFEELEQAVARTKTKGDWSDIATGKQYRCKDGAIVIWHSKTGTLQFQGKQPVRDRFRDALLAELETDSEGSSLTAAPPVSAEARHRVFVVHGHDQAAREQLELILHKLGLEPYVLANTGGGGLTIIQALENEMDAGPNRIRFGIVLMTPDDMGYAKIDGPKKAEPRARQNVVLEMGMLMAAIGRPKVAILKRGHVEVPSDASGIIYIPFNDHVRETVPKLVDRLRDAGFNLDPANITKAST
jgi:predicted nucleotide-binding protein